jgi:Asp-tRNA(Asn)/Glu-tRNA(Gln) amidotransferase A subunit family amidase
VIPLSTSLDHVGPIARTVADAAVIFQAIAGFDEKDKATADVPVEDYVARLGETLRPVRIGVPRSLFFDDLNAEVASAVNHALTGLASLGAELRDIERTDSTDRTLQSAEAYAFHAEYVARTPELYQPETLRRIRTGENVSQDELMKCRRDLEGVRREIEATFLDVEALVTPTTPIPAPTIGELKQNPDLLRPRELLLLRNTRPANVWGLPAISIPCGFTAAGLPIGLQIIGPHWGEAKVLQLAQAYEQATAWHKREPS